MPISKNITILVILTLLISGLYLVLRPRKSDFQTTNQATNAQLETENPFNYLTIPYLRSLIFDSQLGDLELISQNNSYQSYLTSYDSDGLQINGLLTQPTGDMPDGGWPAIVFIHGYIPPAQYQTTQKYEDYVAYLARNGFVVFKIDLRGHGESGGSPSGAYYSPGYIIDTLNAYSALASSDFVNPSKIGLWGHSMAGNIVLRTLAAKPDIPAAVIWAGAGYTYQDLRDYGLNDASYQRPATSSARIQNRQRLFDQLGDINDSNSLWSQIIPTNYLSDFKTVIQLHHAVNDPTVNIGYSRDLAQLLEESNITHQLFEYQSGGHNISGSSFSTAISRTVEFFQNNL